MRYMHHGIILITSIASYLPTMTMAAMIRRQVGRGLLASQLQRASSIGLLHPINLALGVIYGAGIATSAVPDVVVFVDECPIKPSRRGVGGVNPISAIPDRVFVA